MYKISFFVPEANKEKVKDALFAAGAGKIGFYDSCSFEILGVGQFRALPGSNPAQGKIAELERGPEYKVEMVVSKEAVNAVVKALKAAHPYETPAYDVIKLEVFE